MSSIEALEHARYVHLSTHGRHNVVAPAFQSLFIAADQDSDGAVYSHELLRLEVIRENGGAFSPGTLQRISGQAEFVQLRELVLKD